MARRHRSKPLGIIRTIILIFFASTFCVALLYRFVPVVVTPLMIIRCIEQLVSSEPIRLTHNWVPIENISAHLPLATVCSEDQRFFDHHGFDFNAIRQSIKSTQGRGSTRLRGASTISQQTAKNVFLWPHRSWIRKGFEVYFTILIELLWDKKRILEVYLNSIEMADGVYGAEAAARFYYDRSAAKLTRRQAAALAAILPNPREYRAEPPTPYIQERIDWISRQMRLMGRLPW